MARKSRKNLPQPEQAVISVQFPELDEGKIPTAIYGRLSVEDNEDNESMETQIALVQDFINRSSELNYVDTYFDNGFTGTNFKRPAFTRLMNDVRQKKIKCIVVKDLSRFGRNYLEAGYYLALKVGVNEYRFVVYDITDDGKILWNSSKYITPCEDIVKLANSFIRQKSDILSNSMLSNAAQAILLRS